jgi:ABC-type Zn uptake system ZnuABC Zn-binding protein ZnuA
VEEMSLNKEQEDLYKKTMEEAKRQLDGIDGEMEEELQKARERLAKLQESKKSFKQIYLSTAELLGAKVEIQDDEEESAPSDGKSSLKNLQ